MDTHTEAHATNHQSKLNWLRAAVLGANDGIVSVSALVVGVAGATEHTGTLLITGVAGLLSGALSMAVGEYVSVSSQRDVEEALLAKERRELAEEPESELEELTQLYEKKGLERATAEIVARELTAHDAFGAHVETELKINPDELTNPWHAALASGAAFTTGALIPVLTIILPPPGVRVPVTFVAVFLALALTGYLSAKMSDAPVMQVTGRVVFGGILAMLVTFGIGLLFGVQAA
jgi:VIT1/CCC1 family predicted Fe2+/Mn2+ transporter